jgi:hypothetical protein
VEKAGVTANIPDEWSFAVAGMEISYSVASVPPQGGGRWFSRMLERNLAKGSIESEVNESGMLISLPAGSSLTVIESADVVVEGVNFCSGGPKYGDTGMVREVIS